MNEQEKLEFPLRLLVRSPWLLLAALLTVFDQWTKHVAAATWQSEPCVLIPDVLELTYTENDGAAWGIFSGHQTFLIVTTAVMFGVILWALVAGKWQHPVLQVGETLMLAGGIGNLIDRVWNDYVVDFIYVSAIDFAVFNVADCCVCCGAVLTIVYVLFLEKRDAREDRASADDTDGGGAAG